MYRISHISYTLSVTHLINYSFIQISTDSKNSNRRENCRCYEHVELFLSPPYALCVGKVHFDSAGPVSLFPGPGSECKSDRLSVTAQCRSKGCCVIVTKTQRALNGNLLLCVCYVNWFKFMEYKSKFP